MSSSGSGSDPKRGAPPRQPLEALAQGAAGDPVRRALWLDALDQRLRTCLSPPLDAHARLANVNRDRLVYLVDSPAWHARLRMAGPGLLDAARSLGLQVTTLVVRIGRPAARPLEPAPRKAVPMSEPARQALEAALAGLEEPPRNAERRTPGPAESSSE